MISNLVQLPERARTSGNRPALFAGGRMIDYRELASRVNETERGLEALEVGSGDVVAVLLENGLAFAEIAHAIAQRGAVLLPLNARLTPRELAFQLEKIAGSEDLSEAAKIFASLEPEVKRILGELDDYLRSK